MPSIYLNRVVHFLERIAMMRAVVTVAGGGVELAEVPEPAEAQDHQVVVQVTASAVGRGDLNVSRFRPAGSTLGMDVVGVVARAARDGSGPAVGTRVMGYATDGKGTWAERVVIDTALIAPIPDGLSDELAASLPNSGLAAWDGVASGGSILGKRVLITGATGGVGLIAAQLAVLSGAEVTALVSSRERASVLPFRDRLFPATLDELDGTFDLIVDLVGGDVLSKALTLVASGGTVASLAQTAQGPATVPVFWFASHVAARLVSVDNRVALRTPGEGARKLAALGALAASGSLETGVTVVAPWEQAGELLARLDRREITGRAIITVT